MKNGFVTMNIGWPRCPFEDCNEENDSIAYESCEEGVMECQACGRKFLVKKETTYTTEPVPQSAA